MNKDQLLERLSDYNPNSRVWIYQADRKLTTGEIDIIDSHIQPFAKTWAHHGKDLKSYAGILYDLFIVFVVDETTAEVGGCGIDGSVHLVQKISAEMNIDFFNRFAVSFFNGDKVECLTKEYFTELVTTDKNWTDKTLVFNNQINTLATLNTNWIIPFKDSWHKNFFSKADSFDLTL
jgi:hypothetical protein